jgi:Phage integrase, N-terminal SAM-like domain
VTQLRNMQTSFDRGQVLDTGSLTVGRHLTIWLEAIKPNIAPNTYVDYGKNIAKIQRCLGNIRIGKLTALRVQQMYTEMERDGITAASQRQAGTTLGVALQHAVRLRLVPYNVARDVQKPRVRRKEIQPLGTPKRFDGFSPAPSATDLLPCTRSGSIQKRERENYLACRGRMSISTASRSSFRVFHRCPCHPPQGDAGRGKLQERWAPSSVIVVEDTCESRIC